MKKILLISNYVFHYRIKIYNYIYSEFKEIGYEFYVLTNRIQKVDYDILFPLTIKKANPVNYLKFIKDLNPDVVITFLHLKNYVIFFIHYYCKIVKIPVIYWNHGINLKTPNAYWKNIFFWHIHSLSDAIILYSPIEKKYIKEKNHHKIFIAYNTLNFTDIDRTEYPDKNYLKNKFNINEKYIILFVGRINTNKRLNILLECFRNNEDIAIVVVGPGIRVKQLKIINNISNYYYTGETYNKKVIRNIFNSSDIFCIPGRVGLALIEAFFWGLPVFTFFRNNSPEIYYLKEGYNGYIVDTIKEFEEITADLLNNPVKYNNMANNARKTYEEKAHIRNMFKGFKEAINYLEKISIKHVDNRNCNYKLTC